MPQFYRLGNVVDAIAGSDDPNTANLNALANTGEADSSAALLFFQQAQIAEVFGFGCNIYIQGALVIADQATDEPFTAGQMVYVSQTQGGGWLIHGSVKT